MRINLWILAKAFGVLLYALVIASFVHKAIDYAKGSPAVTDLIQANGELTHVSKCSTGRRARFVYTFTTPNGAMTAHLTCPNGERDLLEKSVGGRVKALYGIKYDTLFMPEVDVYELHAAHVSIGSYSQRASTARSIAPWAASIYALTAVVLALHLVLLIYSRRKSRSDK